MRKAGMLIAVTVLAACGGSKPLPPESRVVAGFGDSVAAGQGVGPSRGYPNNPLAYPALIAKRLGWTPYNFAISGACAMTAGSAGADPSTPDSCKVSVLADELPLAERTLPSEPGLIVITVGGNDMKFADCERAAVLPSAAALCDQSALDRRAAAVEANIGRLLGDLRKRWPHSRIVLSTYYVPVPGPASSDADVCPMYEPLAAFQRPLSLVAREQTLKAMREIQSSVYDRAASLIEALNGGIRRAATAAGVAATRVDFTGHDLCRAEAGGSAGDVWVYGPEVHLSFSAGILPPRRFDFTLPAPCKDTSSEPAPIGSDQPVRINIAGISVEYTLSAKANCMPHPTAEGQHALADAVLRALPDGFGG